LRASAVVEAGGTRIQVAATNNAVTDEIKKNTGNEEQGVAPDYRGLALK
jgi:hypothetical protein